MKTHLSAAVLLLAATAAACGPRMQPVRAVQPNGAIVPSTADETTRRARAEGEAEQARLAAERDQTEAQALASCAPAVCQAVARGEVTLGMTEAQVMAATRTTAEAWTPRGGGRITTLTPRDEVRAPADRIAPVAYVSFENGVVRSFAYREAEGVRLVSSPADAGREGRARFRADALLEEGDELAARGDFVAALDRYDRADVIDPGNPAVSLRIARALDKQLRPYEASIRYRLFLHQLELEKIRAYGEAYAHLYAAVAEARDRIIVLERGGR